MRSPSLTLSPFSSASAPGTHCINLFYFSHSLFSPSRSISPPCNRDFRWRATRGLDITRSSDVIRAGASAFSRRSTKERKEEKRSDETRGAASVTRFCISSSRTIPTAGLLEIDYYKRRRDTEKREGKERSRYDCQGPKENKQRAQRVR